MIIPYLTIYKKKWFIYFPMIIPWFFHILPIFIQSRGSSCPKPIPSFPSMQSVGTSAHSQSRLSSGSMQVKSWPTRLGNLWWILPQMYPLVLTNIAVENGHWFREFSHSKWWLSIVMLVYQRVAIRKKNWAGSLTMKLCEPMTTGIFFADRYMGYVYLLWSIRYYWISRGCNLVHGGTAGCRSD